MSDLKIIRQACRDFAKLHLHECCTELIEWQDSAVLRDGRVRELAAMANEFVGHHDGLRVAESLINRAAIDHQAARDTSARDAALEEAAVHAENIRFACPASPTERAFNTGIESAAKCIRVLKSATAASSGEKGDRDA